MVTSARFQVLSSLKQLEATVLNNTGRERFYQRRKVDGQLWPRTMDESGSTRTQSHDISEDQGQKENPKSFQKGVGTRNRSHTKEEKSEGH